MKLHTSRTFTLHPNTKYLIAMTAAVILVAGALTLPLAFDEHSADAKKSKKSKKTTKKTKKASIESEGGNGGDVTGGADGEGGSACFEIGSCFNDNS